MKYKRCNFCNETIWDKVFLYRWKPGAAGSNKSILLNCCDSCKPAVDEAILNCKIEFFPAGPFRKALNEAIGKALVEEKINARK